MRAGSEEGRETVPLFSLGIKSDDRQKRYVKTGTKQNKSGSVLILIRITSDLILSMVVESFPKSAFIPVFKVIIQDQLCIIEQVIL